ncbi:MAG: CHAT domain-containing protein, partial [Deltaproteobacteria bacterium]
MACRETASPVASSGPAVRLCSAPPRSPLLKHTILFLAANPLGTERVALDEEARAIHEELERTGHRDSFELVTRWAVRPLDLLRELRKLKPTIVHFSGHGGRGDSRPGAGPHRDVVGEPDAVDERQQGGLFFQGTNGQPQLVSTAALKETFGAAGSSVRLVVLNACYSEVQAEALLAHVECVIGMSGSIGDDAARSFAIGFYGTPAGLVGGSDPMKTESRPMPTK